MRKVSKAIAEAFFAGKAKTVGNTITDGQSVWLHGNLIARKTDGGLSSQFETTLAGWATPTTRERVNTLLHYAGSPYRYAQRNHVPVVVDITNMTFEEIESNEWMMHYNIVMDESRIA